MKLPKPDSDELLQQTTIPSDPSAVNLELKGLLQRVQEAMEARERLPQPLFWSLFGHAVRDIREKKERSRLLQELFDSIK